jgi:hypothetical protein
MTRDQSRLAELIPRLLALALAGFSIYSLAMVAVLHFLPAESLPPLLADRWALGGVAPAVSFWAAYTLGMIASSGICLPSFYFFGLLAGLRLSFAQTVAHIVKGKGATTVMLVGLLPAVRVSRVDPNDLLKSGAGTGASRKNRREYGAMVIAEIGLSLALLSGAAVVVRSAAQQRFQITLAQAEQTGANLSIGRPFGEGHFGDQRRTHPMCAARDRSRQASGERTLRLREIAQTGTQRACARLGETRAHLTGEGQRAMRIVDPDQQRADPNPASLRIRPPTTTNSSRLRHFDLSQIPRSPGA